MPGRDTSFQWGRPTRPEDPRRGRPWRRTGAAITGAVLPVQRAQARGLFVLMGLHARQDIAGAGYDFSKLYPDPLLVILGRDFAPCLASVSSTWVAQITGTCAASHNHRISSWISASRTQPSSTARLPRAIMMPRAWRPMVPRMIPGRFLTARPVSILAISVAKNARIFTPSP